MMSLDLIEDFLVNFLGVSGVKLLITGLLAVAPTVAFRSGKTATPFRSTSELGFGGTSGGFLLSFLLIRMMHLEISAEALSIIPDAVSDMVQNSIELSRRWRNQYSK